jgi:hypothetical protein
MRNRTATLTLGLPLIVLLSACAGTTDTNSNQQQVASRAAVDPNEVTCKNIIKTGTRIGTRVCKTNQTWEQERRDSREATERIQRGAAQTQTMAEGG